MARLKELNNKSIVIVILYLNMYSLKMINKNLTLIGILLVFTISIILWTQPNFNQSGTIKIWDRNNILLYESAGIIGKKIAIIYDKLPKYVVDATVASEDSSFWTNSGIDSKAIIRSSIINLKSWRIISGASTITQQLARIAIISPYQSAPRTFLRKMREILIALRLNFAYSKKNILTKYLNEVYYGNLSYGIQAASNTYFHKDVSQLSLAESAFLTGLISSPEVKNPFLNMKAAKAAQINVLDLMVKNGFINKIQADESKKEEIEIVKPTNDIKAPHFVYFIQEELKKIKLKNKEGINVYTTLDYPSYTLSKEIAKLWVDKLRNEHELSNASLVLIKNKTGEILDMLGGIDYFDTKNDGQVNLATSLRQPGSALKPITYTAAFMQGYTPATLIYDIKKVYKTKKGEGFTPNNYDDRFHGLVLAREALASSLNLPAVEMLNRIGIKNFLNVAKNLGITTFNQEERYDLSLTLGGGEVKLLDLTNVYASFAREGIYRQPYAIEKIITDTGETIYEHRNDNGIQALGQNGKQITYLISNILSDPKARLISFNEKNPLVLSHPAAVKTGTTTDWHDNWTVGYTVDYTVGVWVGNNDNHPMKEITGIVGAAPIWNQFFEEFLKGKPIKQFSKPEHIKKVEICKITGQLSDNICPEKITELFIEGTEPKETSKILKLVKIDRRNNLLASDKCPVEFTENKVFIDYPPEVYSWAIENNQEIIPKVFSPLCENDKGSPLFSEKPFLSITYPKEGTVFQSAPFIVNNQAVVFEINVSFAISKISWYVDDNLYKISNELPFKVSWVPKIGTHVIYVIGQTTNNQTIKSEKVHFSVLEYQGGS